LPPPSFDDSFASFPLSKARTVLSGQSLRLVLHHVNGVALGAETRYGGGVLTVSQAEARATLAAPALADGAGGGAPSVKRRRAFTFTRES